MTYENLSRWAMPDHYFGATWPEYYSSGVGRSRDSRAQEESNFQCMLRELGGESDTVLVIRESHWAVGWVEWIAIHESDATALATADSIMESLADYPLVDESHCSELECEGAAESWENLSPRDRVEFAISERARYHWLLDESVWIYGRMDFSELANYESTISNAMYESLRDSV